jgi:hypothetical protein
MLYMDYKNKYIKYKQKYLELKQKGGMNCVNERVFRNLLNTCWMIAIQMMMCFGDATKDQIERELAQSNLNIELISILDKELQKILPSNYSNLQTDKRIDYLYILLDAFIKRYIAKVERHFPILIKPEENLYRCERIISNAYKLLFQNLIDIKKDGGIILDYYFFANILSTFFLKQEIYFSSYTRKMFNQIKFNNEKDIGIQISIKKHSCCFFVCGDVPKFYNDNDKKIYNCNFKELLTNLKDDEDLFVIPTGVVALNRYEYFNNIERFNNYDKIQSLTIVSKNNFENNFNQEIKLFFNNDYDKINNFHLLYKIGKKFYDEEKYDEAFTFFNKGEKYEYFPTMFLLGEIYSKKDLDKAIEYYQKALDNGFNGAARILVDIYIRKREYEKAEKFLKFAVYIED